MSNKLTFKKLNFDHQFINDYSSICIQAQLAEVTEKLLEIDKKLDSLISFQQTDRISKVVAGIHIYEQAYLAKNNTIREQQLVNALQTLNESRTNLMFHLQKIIKLKIREKKMTDYFWRIIFIDKREIDLFNELKLEQNNIKEDIKYISLANVYIFRSQILLNQKESAQIAKQQYFDFYGAISDGINKISDYISCNNDKIFLEEIHKMYHDPNELLNVFDEKKEITIEITTKDI